MTCAWLMLRSGGLQMCPWSSSWSGRLQITTARVVEKTDHRVHGGVERQRFSFCVPRAVVCAAARHVRSVIGAGLRL